MDTSRQGGCASAVIVIIVWHSNDGLTQHVFGVF